MPMQRDLIKIVSSPVLHNSGVKIKGKKDAKDGGQYTVPSEP